MACTLIFRIGFLLGVWLRVWLALDRKALVGTLAGTSGGTLIGTLWTLWLGLKVFGWAVGEQKQKHSEGGRTKTFCHRDLAMER